MRKTAIIAASLVLASCSPLMAGGLYGDDYSTGEDFDGNAYVLKRGQPYSRTVQDFDGNYHEQYQDGTSRSYDSNPYLAPRPRYSESIYD